MVEDYKGSAEILKKSIVKEKIKTSSTNKNLNKYY